MAEVIDARIKQGRPVGQDFQCGRCGQYLWNVIDGHLNFHEEGGWFYDDGVWCETPESRRQRRYAEAQLQSGRWAPDDPDDPRQLSRQDRVALRRRLKRNQFSRVRKSDPVPLVTRRERLDNAERLDGAFDLPACVVCPACPGYVVNRIVDSAG